MSDRRLTPELLLGAYASGIFPMAETRDDPEVYWVDPQYRGVLPLDGFHMSRSLARRMRRGDVTATLDVAFDEIIEGCAARDETWINDTIRDLMGQLFVAGFAHGFGVWRREKLIGGMYGLTLGGAFFGESMFSTERDASKVALIYLSARLIHGGYRLLDTQFITDHLAQFGAEEISRAVFHRRLTRALQEPGDFAALDVAAPPQDIIDIVRRVI